MMAADPALVSSAQQLVRDKRLDPSRAVWQAAAAVIEQLAALAMEADSAADGRAAVRSRIPVLDELGV